MSIIPEDDGIYEYISSVWQRAELRGPYVPSADGIYLLYFRNRRCGGCKSFDKVFLRFIEDTNSRRCNVALVQCNSFFFDCESQDAADTFLFYLVFATPQVVLVVIEDGLPVYIEREIGFIDEDRLKDFVFNVDKRRREYEASLSEEEGGEGIYIDLSSKDWKSIVDKIRDELFRGRNIREVCDEHGCRIIIE